jgi:glycosyltransferase involved in cell wall biosynthesis
MTSVTVALPVHNGEKTIQRCLESLSLQSCNSFKVIVFENMSTDNTRSIVETFIQKDRRFEIRPSVSFLTARENFLRAASECVTESEFFCFRAADDFSTSNYLEVLLESLKANEGCALSVSSVSYVSQDGSGTEPKRDSILEFQKESKNRFRGMIFPGSWFYGVYRSRLAGQYLLTVFNLFPYPWGMDRLVVYKMMADFGIVFSAETTLVCQVDSGSDSVYKARSWIDAIGRRVRYYSACMDMDLHKNTTGIIDALQSRHHAWKLAGRHTGTRLGQIIRLVMGRKISS